MMTQRHEETRLCEYESYSCHYAVMGLKSNEFSSVNSLYGRKLSTRSRRRESGIFVLVYRAYYVSIFLWRYVNCSILYKGDGLQLIICAYY